MPRAGGSIAAQIKYAYKDNDTDEVSEAPPVQNTWYEVMNREDARLIWCQFLQTNDEAANKDVEIKWTIDGNVYFYGVSVASASPKYVYRIHVPSAGGTAGLTIDTEKRNAAYNVDKRGQAFKVEIRTTSVPGTNQVLTCRCTAETLEET